MAYSKCKGCEKRKEYLEKGLNCHSVCEDYKKFVEMNEKIKQMKTNEAIFHSIRRDSYHNAPMNNPRKNHRKKI